MNLAAFESIFNVVLGLDPIVIGVLKRILASGLLIGPLAKLAPFLAELEHALELVDKLHGLNLPAPTPPAAA